MSLGKYIVWCEDWASEEHADLIEASSSQDAAELYAEACFDEPFERITCTVIAPDGERKMIQVDVSWDPSFHAHEVKTP